MVVTFYSFKGGVGRSMALMNVAEILADMGYQVTVCDWDLEAPGLEHYVCDRAEDARAWLSQPGLMDLVAEYKAALANPPAAGRRAAEADPADFDLLGDLPVRRPSSLALRVSQNGSRYRAGDIRFLTAGRRDGESARKYSEAVSDSDWSEFYSKWAGSAYFEFLRRDLETQGFESSSDETAREANRIVLIDSRTGITEVGGVCTHHLAHLVLLFSAANRQNIAGTETMLQSLRSGPAGEAAGPSARGVVPIAARIDTLSETSLVTDFLREFKEQFSRYVPAVLGNAQDFLQESMIPYAPVFAFKETIVARQPAEQRHPGLFKPYQVLAEGIVRWGKAAGRLRAAAPGPEPLTASVSPVQTGASVAPRTVQLIPKGSFYFSWQAADRERAAGLAEQLQSAGLEIWSDLLPRKVRPHEPVATQIQAALQDSVGCIILLPRERDSLWLDAELNFALGQQARREEYRVLLLAQDRPGRSLPPSLARFPLCVLPPTEGDAEAATRILGELLPAQKLVPEPTTSEVIGSLRSPSEQESRFYFGRDEEIDQIVGQIERLLTARQSLLVISGPAGCGKTSLVRAGVLPVFQRGWFQGRHEAWQIVSVNPGQGNFEYQLRSALASVPGLGDLLAAQVGWNEVLARLGKLTRPLLLFVDDAETFFQPPESVGNLPTMLERLDELQRACREGFFAVAAVRGGSLETLRSSPGTRATADAFYQMGPLSADGIRQYFEGAARLLGLDTETGLLDLMVSDAVRLGVTGRVLGLLFHRFWQEKRVGEMITHQAYRSFNGLEGLLTESTGQTLEQIDQRTRGAAHRIVVSLVHPRTGALLERTRDELIAPFGLELILRHLRLPVLRAPTGWKELMEKSARADPANGEALRGLLDAGAVVTTSAGCLRLASPALAQIPLVQQWLAKDLPASRERADLEDAAQRWAEAGNPAYLLLRGKGLRMISPTNVVDELGFSYCLASIMVDRTYRRRVTAVASSLLGALLALVLLFTVFFKQEQRKKDEELRRSKEDLTRALESLLKTHSSLISPLPGPSPGNASADPPPTEKVSTPPAAPAGTVPPTPQVTPGTPAPAPFATQGLTVEYFAKQEDGDRVTEVLGNLGVEFTKRASSASGMATNVIAYGEPVDLHDVLRLARQLVQAGVSISSIHAIQGPKQNEPLIQLSSDYNAQQRPVYTDEELQAGRIHIEDLKVVPVEVGVVVDHAAQEARLNPALDTLRSENYNVGPAEIATPRNRVTETVVRYFAEKDGEQAGHILSDLQRAGVRDGRPSYVLPAQAAGSPPGTFEIWLSAQAFAEEKRK